MSSRMLVTGGCRRRSLATRNTSNRLPMCARLHVTRVLNVYFPAEFILFVVGDRRPCSVRTCPRSRALLSARES